ncbi:HAD family hydrolase [Kitasatospora sp. NPDC101801]|uniref:HAD family hydrolase n=1 Tax=Kitasatospora sp. NPDC101801 TaxID=3364103 RepID=UPI00382697D7
MREINESLAAVLAPVRHVLLDFDGPVCSVFAGRPAAEVAARMSAELVARGEELPAGIETERDPLALLRRIDGARPELTAWVDGLLEQLEVEAVQVAAPNREGEVTLKACADSGRTVWMVSNNAGRAIQSYVELHGLQSYVAGVYGRVPGDPSSMKPSTRLLDDAMTAAAAKPEACVFIGDAVRDVEAANAAGIRSIGYANKPGKAEALAAAGAAVVVGSMREIADALT